MGMNCPKQSGRPTSDSNVKCCHLGLWCVGGQCRARFYSKSHLDIAASSKQGQGTNTVEDGQATQVRSSDSIAALALK